TVFPCREVSNPSPKSADVFLIEAGAFNANTPDGTMRIDRSAIGTPDAESVKMTEAPVYAGEIDPLGFYDADNHISEAAPHFDDHVLIVNGKWVFHKTPDPQPIHAMQEFMGGKFRSANDLTFDLDPISIIEPDKKTV